MVLKQYAMLTSIALLIASIYLSQAYGHQAFNAQEQTIGGYRIALSTNPEVPGPEKLTILHVDVTDRDYNPLPDVRAGVKILKNDELVHEVGPRILSTGQLDVEYIFPDSGVYVVDVYVLDFSAEKISAKFNVGVLEGFGYIFYSMVLIGAFFPAILVGYILLKKRKEKKQMRT